MDFNEPSEFSFIETSDMNLDEFLNIDSYLGNQQTELFTQQEQMHGTETSAQSAENNELTSSESQSPSYGNSPSSLSEPGSEAPQSQNHALDANIGGTYFFDQASSWDVTLLDCEFHSINLDVLLEDDPSTSSAMVITSQDLSVISSGASTAETRLSPSSSVSLRQRKRRDPEKLKKNQRKAEKPEKCHVCGKGHACKRDLKRHMVSNHRKEAARMRLDVTKTKCTFCNLKVDTIRIDRLQKHMKKKHKFQLPFL